MSILFSKDILNAIHTELSSAKESVLIVSAYCKAEAIKDLDSFVSSSVRSKKLLLRFRLSDIISGSTDFEVLDYCRKSGWEVYIRFDLHAKTYIFDNSRCIIGSANATVSGLGISDNCNYEAVTTTILDDSDLSKIKNLLNSAFLVTDEIFLLLKKRYENLSDSDKKSEALFWGNEIMKFFRPKIESLFSHELPDSRIPKQRGERMDFLEKMFDGDFDSLKNDFRQSKCYLWLISVLEKNGGCIYFGQLSAELHDSLVSDPKPYRRDVKFWLSNLLSWCEDLKMKEVKVDVPNHSQRITLVS